MFGASNSTSTSTSDFTIEDHMATLCTFMSLLTDTTKNSSSRAGVPPSQLIDLNFQFSSYITASCYLRMRQQISSWSSIGLMCSFYTITDDVILEAYSKRNTLIMFSAHPTRGDRSLVLMLEAISLEEFRHLAEHYPSPGSPVVLENLEHEWKKRTNDGTVYTIYNEDTCVDFHKFIVAVLMSYATGLKHLHEGCSLANQKKWLPLVHNLKCLLWQTVESRAFRTHLEVINDLLVIPSTDPQSISNYQIFADRHGLNFIDVTGIVDPATEHEEELEDEDAQTPNASHSSPHPKAQRRGHQQRIKRLVSYSSAIYTISEYCRAIARANSRPIVFKSNIIAIPAPNDATISWSGIDAALNTICADTSLHKAEEFAKAIKEITVLKCQQGTRHHFIVHKFSQMMNAFIDATGSSNTEDRAKAAIALEIRHTISQIWFAGVPHCELSLFVLLSKLAQEGMRAQESSVTKTHSGIDPDIYKILDLQALAVRRDVYLTEILLIQLSCRFLFIPTAIFLLRCQNCYVLSVT